MHHQQPRLKGLVMHTAGGDETFNVFIYGNAGISVDKYIKSLFLWYQGQKAMRFVPAWKSMTFWSAKYRKMAAFSCFGGSHRHKIVCEHPICVQLSPDSHHKKPSGQGCTRMSGRSCFAIMLGAAKCALVIYAAGIWNHSFLSEAAISQKNG